jgi:hypothetical protein
MSAGTTSVLPRSTSRAITLFRSSVPTRRISLASFWTSALLISADKEGVVFDWASEVGGNDRRAETPMSAATIVDLDMNMATSLSCA